MPRRRIARLIYGAAALLFLCFSGERILFATPALTQLFELAFGGQVRVSYDSAWSVWPGSMHVKNLSLTGQDDNVEWNLGIDEVTFSVSLFSLFKREFHATQVRARGVTWALRQKQLLLDVTPETLFGLPQIPGMQAMALEPYGPPELDTDGTYRLWTIHLDDVEARGVREVWIDKLHLTGNAQVSGGFFLRPMRLLRVMAQVQAEPLSLLIGDDVALSELRGRISTTIEPLDVRAGGGLSKVDVALAISARTGDLAFLARTLPAGETLFAEPGTLRADATIEEGVLRAGSAIEASTERLCFGRAPFLAETAARVTLHALAAGDAGAQVAASAQAELDGLTVRVEGSRAEPLRVARLRLALLSNQLDLAKPLAMSGGSADLEDARLPDLRLLEPLVPAGSKLRLEGGALALHGHLDSAAERTAGALVFAARGARLSGDDVHLRADADATIAVRGKSGLRGPLDLSGSHLSIERAQVSSAQGPDWWGRFEFPKAALDPDTKAVSLELRAECADTRPLRALFAVEGVPAFVATIFTMSGLQIGGDLRVAPGLFRLRDFDAHGRGASIRANYQARRADHGDTEKSGEALIKLGIATAGLDLNGGKPHVVLLGATSWFDKRVKESGDAAAKASSARAADPSAEK